MIKRRKRGPLTASGDVGGPKFRDHVDPSLGREQRAVADLPSDTIGRAVIDGMTVEANNPTNPKRCQRGKVPVSVEVSELIV